MRTATETKKIFNYEDLFIHSSNPYNQPLKIAFSEKDMRAYALYCKDCIVIGNHPLTPYEWKMSQN